MMDWQQSRRLLAELERITLDPKVHDQAVWVEALKNPNQTLGGLSACGTTGCLAGNAVAYDPESELIWTRKEEWDGEQERYVQIGRAHV